MRKIAATIILNLLITMVCLAENPPRPEGDRPASQTLTDGQKASVKAILSKYDAAKLTADDAKAIHRALRDAGLRNGPELNDIIKEAGFDPEKLRDLDPPRGDKARENRPEGQDDQRKEDDQAKNDKQGERNRSEGKSGEQKDKYSIEQAISDNAQLHTIAFSGLAFLTGDYGACTFIPPGKVCDFFGFQYMRDIDAAQKGHNPMFLDRVAGNVMHTLNDKQKQKFLALADKQAVQLEELAKMRLPLIKAFCLQKDGQIPTGSEGLNKEAVKKYVGDIFAFDAELSYERAKVMSEVYLSLTAEQKAYFAKMKFGDFSTWPALDEREALKQVGKGKSKLFNVAYMTYTSEFFSWVKGSIEADTYFCPERHGTYFGGFYMKDMPAMGKRNYDISTSVTGDSGKSFLDDVLTAEQRSNVTSIADTQRNLLNEVITVRKNISVELRKFLAGKTPDKTTVVNLGRKYGELDGEMSWYYTMAFSKANKTLTEQQKAALMKLRNLDGYTSAPYYIYSSPAQDQPVLNKVDAFFTSPK